MKIKDFTGEKVWFCPDSQMIFGKNKSNKKQSLLVTRGWGFIASEIKEEGKAYDFRNIFGQWVADAVNEKLNLWEKKK